MGERTPHCDPDARAALVGLAASHGRGHVVRAILEGVAFSLRDTFSIFSELDLPVGHVRLGGGGSRSALWRQIQADVYDHAVDTASAEEGAAYGAAILAAVGIGCWPTVDVACDALVRGATVTLPQPEVVSAMHDRYAAYTRLYPTLQRLTHGRHA
jgi:xylulokinase